MSELYHYGMPRRSGRYPYGSGDDPFQHNGPTIMGRAEELKAKNPTWTDKDIAKALDMSTIDYQAIRSAAKDEKWQEDRARAYNLREQKQLSNTAIAKELGVSEGTVRNFFKDTTTRKSDQIDATMEVLRKSLKEKGCLDVSEGAAERIGITENQLKAAYMRMAVNGEVSLHNVGFEQLGTGKQTLMKVIAPVDASPQEVKNGKIHMIDAYVENDTRTIRNIEPPVSINPNRIKIRYAEDGGTDKDGVIELRKGVPDIDLHDASYAQVRIAVNDSHYLKGMAVKSDNIPDGYDIVFNTNKHRGVPMLGPDKDHSVLKLLNKKADGTIDNDNPFGATIQPEEKLKKCQMHYTDAKGKTKQSALNIVNEEGSWDTWSKTLSSQFLSKQPVGLIRKQLNYTYADKKAEFEEIKSINNPIVKKHLLEHFAESCDKDAVSLKASALPRQTSRVILPLPKMSPTEVYAPGYKQGERVVLVRYPHAGTFEIPELKVNNNVPSGKKLFGNTKDAIGIHPKVAARLSGADFDGDSVVVIPVNSRVRVKTSKPLKGLVDFEPKEVYKGYKGMKRMSDTQKQMGMISNLITDMTLKGAPDSHIERAVKHSMVVIDAEKHNLDYQTSAKINGITELRKLYQGSAKGGASTLISRSKSPKYIDQVKDNYRIDKKTGEKIYIPTGARKWKRDADGNWVDNGPKQTKTSKMAATKDARSLLSKNPNEKEMLYASYANNMKHLANQARLESLRVPPQKYNKSAAKTYSNEVRSLEKKLNDIARQKPLERQAQMIAGSHVKAALAENPSLYQDRDKLKKVRNQALEGARYRVGKTKSTVEISDREWDAIQAGAIPAGKARKILTKADSKAIRERATPKQKRGLSDAQQIRLKGMAKSGYMTQEEIADALGVSISTVRRYM